MLPFSIIYLHISVVRGLFYFIFFKFLLDRDPFYGTTGTLCFGLSMPLPMSFKVREDLSSHALFCCLCITILRVLSLIDDTTGLSSESSLVTGTGHRTWIARP